MKIFDIFKSALLNLFRRKARTVLTVIGVVVGAAAIILMVSLGLGMNASLDAYIESMGDLTMIDLNSYVWIPDEGDNSGYGGESRQNNLNDELVEKIRAMDGVLAVTPYVYVYNASVYANRIYQCQWANIIGVAPEMLPYLDLELAQGEWPSASNGNFILVGPELIYEFRDPNKPIFDWYKEFYNADGTRKPPKVDLMSARIYLQINTNDYTYDEYGNRIETGGRPKKKYNISEVAILGESDTNYESRYSIYTSIELANKLNEEAKKAGVYYGNENGGYDTIKIKAVDIESAERIQAELNELGVYTYGLSDIRNTMQNNQKTTQLILGAIGLMSLFVAAVGIANTMVMAIYERTREIGIMKVLGCKLQNIKTMFLIEASTIGFFGGVIGVGLSILASKLMNTYLADSSLFGSTAGMEGVETTVSVIPFWLIILSVIFSTLVGLLSGYFPARRATKISALEAIKND